jgi:integrase
MLTDLAVRAAKPRERPYKLWDAGGMFLMVTPRGSRWWRLKYRVDGREKSLSLGVYPRVSLALARERRERAKELIEAGIDPSEQRQAEKRSRSASFESVAREWLALQAKTDAKHKQAAFSKRTWDRALGMFERLIFPHIGRRPIAKITVPELLQFLKRIEASGHHDTCHRAKQRCGQVFRYAIVTGRAERDLTADLRGALAPVRTKNFAAITDPVRIGELMRDIDSYCGYKVTTLAMKLAPLVFVRPGELRAAEWKEFDLDRAEWRIPAERMKMREEHLVPLSTQALQIIRELQALTGDGRYVFPSPRMFAKPMSENAITAALRRMGYTGNEMTWHGFRSLASTCLNEQGWHPDLIELQLAHAERNKVRAAYNRAQRLAERRRMMQSWADYLDELRTEKNAVPIAAQAA